MTTDGGAGRQPDPLQRAPSGNVKLGRILAIIGILSILGGVGFFVVTATVSLAPAFLPIYRELAVGLAGYGLPAVLSGLVVAQRSEAWVDYVSLLGVTACSLAVLLFVWTYPARWSVTGGTGYVIAVLVTYSLGLMICAFGAGVAVGCSTPEDEEDEFIWGDPSES